MATNSHIEWTEATWNPVTDCTKMSAGCAHCYAERMAKRLQAMGQPNYARGFALMLHEHALELPLRWKGSKRIFVNSMSDLFHADVPLQFIQKAFDVMCRARQHQFQILTKRSERLLRVSDIRDQCRNAGVAFFFKQWAGVFKSRTGRELDGRTWDQMPNEHPPAWVIRPVEQRV